MTATEASDRLSVCVVSLIAYTYFRDVDDISPGGAERQLYLLSQQLRDEFDVHFVVGDYGQPKTERRDGVTLHRAYTPTDERAAYRRFPDLARLFDAMRRADADVCVFRGDRLKATITYAFSRLLGSAWVYNLAVDSHAESDADRTDPLATAFRRVIRDADGIVAQSPRQQRRLRESFGVDSTVVPNGYPPVEEDTSRADADEETAETDAHSAADGEFFLYVGRINRDQKRPHLFLDLAERLPDVRFLLVGAEENDPAYYDEIARRADRLDNVRFPGKVPPDEIYDYYDRAYALVNTSAQEGFPNTFLEAWRSGTPVVSLDVDPGRFLGGESVGYADGDFERLTAIARRLADSPDLRESLGERGRDHFEENFRISVTAERYADVVRSSADAAAESTDRGADPETGERSSVGRSPNSASGSNRR
ncbi:glycosyltransferase family 4 protein [Halorussus salinus]|uniref:glycosyltransferase family 4 protein n=1 Tax=Halorussus salinus TaxID=1364935 RepID=UPI0010929122|nr:glycosyltransferase family 4 protein [Halorussus salinus]